jgi:hypothetical protein
VLVLVLVLLIGGRDRSGTGLTDTGFALDENGTKGGSAVWALARLGRPPTSIKAKSIFKELLCRMIMDL